MARNVKVGGGEVDIVASIGGRLVVVEVRTITGYTDPLDAFDRRKALQVKRLAAGLKADRVDLMAIRLGRRVDLHWVKDVD